VLSFFYSKEPQKQKKGKKTVADQEYGVSRGVDFKGVEAVINFDFPPSVRSYTHRIGRTARGGASGMSLSLVAPEDMGDFVKVEASQGGEMKPFLFNMKDVEGFRYRVGDAVRAVTRAQVKEARLKEIRREILNSEKLKACRLSLILLVLLAQKIPPPPPPSIGPL